jgi:hypothetical protein
MYILEDLAGDIFFVAKEIKKEYGETDKNAIQLENASQMVRDWAEAINKDINNGKHKFPEGISQENR